MKISLKLFLPVMIAVLVIVAVVAIWLGGSDRAFIGGSKNSCDHRFFEWCKGYPTGGVDYDNFGVANRDCIGQGSYRTCDQVNEALG